SLAERHAVFSAMLSRMGSGQVVPAEPDAAMARRLMEVSWGGEPLFLMMAAVAAARSGVGAALALTHTEAALQLADGEIERIERFADGRPDRARFLAQLAAIATLAQGLTSAEA